MALWSYQYIDFLSHDQFHTHHRPPMHPQHGTPPFPRGGGMLIPLPLFIDGTYALLVVGLNLAIALVFKGFDDKLEREQLTKANAESQLAYLKAQINPHFYMNMLNNIHGMIEIDPERAQDMVIEMSRLMRHMLYDSSKPQVALADEVEFMRNYLKLMRERFPENRLRLSATFPTQEQMAGISIPPLLFLVFVENAFKHGVSYREASHVDVDIWLTDSRLCFTCTNSDHARSASHGIGLTNVTRRLALIYGDKASLHIDRTPNPPIYKVTLTIPVHETAHSDN